MRIPPSGGTLRAADLAAGGGGADRRSTSSAAVEAIVNPSAGRGVAERVSPRVPASTRETVEVAEGLRADQGRFAGADPTLAASALTALAYWIPPGSEGRLCPARGGATLAPP